MKMLPFLLLFFCVPPAYADTPGVNCTTGRVVSGTLASDVTDGTATTVIAAQGAGVVTQLITVLVTNSHATQGTVVKVLDGSTSKIRAYAGALGGGFVFDFSKTPLQGTANTAWRIQAETSGAALQATYVGCLLTAF